MKEKIQYGRWCGVHPSGLGRLGYIKIRFWAGVSAAWRIFKERHMHNIILFYDSDLQSAETSKELTKTWEVSLDLITTERYTRVRDI